MSNSRSPREVRSMTIGISGMGSPTLASALVPTRGGPRAIAWRAAARSQPIQQSGAREPPLPAKPARGKLPGLGQALDHSALYLHQLGGLLRGEDLWHVMVRGDPLAGTEGVMADHEGVGLERLHSHSRSEERRVGKE